MKKYILKVFVLILALALILPSCTAREKEKELEFSLGFASCELELEEDLTQYYIAGYKNGKHPEGILDLQKIKAVWIENGLTSILLISVDCIALDSKTVNDIRKGLKDFCRDSGCSSVNVVSTHTHAGVDTLGLWGPIGISGKNAEFTKQIISSAEAVAKQAYENRGSGKLLYSKTETVLSQIDSRAPYQFDKNIYQLRFVPNDTSKNGIRIVSFAAHPESLRGNNRLISADYPSVISRIVKERCGDDVIFFSGAIGGLIATTLLDSDDLVNNMELTGRKLSEYILTPSEETELEPKLSISRVEFETKLENTIFLYYKFLGILGNEVKKDIHGDYFLKTELSVVSIGDITLALLPGEIFPELVNGTKNESYPEPLALIAKRYGLNNLVIIGLANDEIGYIIPPIAFELDILAPYLDAPDGHYEETNSVGPECADDIVAAFEKAAKELADK